MDIHIEHVLARADKVVELLELNAEKTQKLLERVECIDNTLDNMESEDCQNALLEGLNQIVRRLEAIIQQGRP